MSRGDKSSYTDKQKRQVAHIESAYEKRGVNHQEAVRRALGDGKQVIRRRSQIGFRAQALIMFVDSMILHAQTEASQQQQAGAATHPQQESTMEKTPQQPGQPQQSQQSQQQPGQTTAKPAQMQQQSQSQSQSSAPLPRQSVDPLGRPMYQGSPRFTDQQAGGDLTGDESDARDDNFVVTGSGQNARDVSAHATRLSASSAESQRYMGVTVPASPAKVPQAPVEAAPQPDGSEDPGANADDGLVPRQHDGSASQQH